MQVRAKHDLHDGITRAEANEAESLRNKDAFLKYLFKI